MHIKDNINIVNFLKQVQKCNAEVLFVTPEGDRIALKSTLSQYIFCTIASNPEILSSIILKNSKSQKYTNNSIFILHPCEVLILCTCAQALMAGAAKSYWQLSNRSHADSLEGFIRISSKTSLNRNCTHQNCNWPSAMDFVSSLRGHLSLKV